MEVTRPEKPNKINVWKWWKWKWAKNFFSRKNFQRSLRYPLPPLPPLPQRREIWRKGWGFRGGSDARKWAEVKTPRWTSGPTPTRLILLRKMETKRSPRPNPSSTCHRVATFPTFTCTEIPVREVRLATLFQREHTTHTN